MLSRAEKILLWSSNISGFGVGMLGPLYAVFATEIGGNVFEVAWVYATYLMVMGVGMLIVGKYADTFGLERILVAGRALNAVAAFSYLLVGSVQALVLVQVLVGIAHALREPTWYALYDKHSGDGSRDGYIWSLTTGLWYISSGIALLTGGYIVATYSFDTLFIVMGIVLTVSTLYQARILQYRVQ
jgi:MFS family permease